MSKLVVQSYILVYRAAFYTAYYTAYSTLALHLHRAMRERRIFHQRVVYLLRR